jgi:hypothetical protein
LGIPFRFNQSEIESRVERRDAPAGPPGVDDYVGFKIAEGERRVAIAV